MEPPEPKFPIESEVLGEPLHPVREPLTPKDPILEEPVVPEPTDIKEELVVPEPPQVPISPLQGMKPKIPEKPLPQALPMPRPVPLSDSIPRAPYQPVPFQSLVDLGPPHI